MKAKSFPVGCSTCPLRTGFNHRIKNSGPEPCSILVVGEAPGQQEERQGKPFVGQSGQLLNSILHEAGISRDAVAVTNSCLCRPPGNRTPTPAEIAACSGHLEKTIERVNPDLIVGLGGTAARALLGKKNVTISALRGRMVETRIEKRRAIFTYHPAFALRQGESSSRAGRGGYDKDTVVQMMTQDIKRAVAAAGGTEADLPANQQLRKYVCIDTVERVRKMAGFLRKAAVIAWDTETSGLDFEQDYIVGFSFSVKPGTGWYLPWRYWPSIEDFGTMVRPLPFWKDADARQEIKKLLREILSERNDVVRVTHNGNFDATFVWWQFGFQPLIEFDTLLAHHLLNENAAHDLEALSFAYTDMGGYDVPMNAWLIENRNAIIKAQAKRYALIGPPKVRGGWQRKGLAPVEMTAPYAGGDADCTLRCYYKFIPMLESEGVAQFFYKVVCPAHNLMTRLIYHGVMIDPSFMEQMRTKYLSELEQLRKDFITKSGAQEGINLSSNQQLTEVIYGKEGLGLPVMLKSKKTGKPSLDEEAIDLLQEHHSHPALDLLMRYRKLSKLVTTYLNRVGDKNGRLHPRYSLGGTVTGRLNCKEPAVQNIPRESEMRQCYITPPGRQMVEMDFAQAEFRVWGALAKDEVLLGDVRQGIDIHRTVAAGFFGIEADKVTKEQRYQAKTTVFGTMYGRGTKSIAKEFHTSELKVKRLLEMFFGRYAAAQAWLRRTEKFAQIKGYVANPFGRKRRLPSAQSHDDEERAGALRMAVNSPIQSTVSDYVILTALRCQRSFDQAGLNSVIMILEVHDSLVYECDEKDVQAVVKIITREARRGTKVLTNCPWDVEVKVGNRWGKTELVGDDGETKAH